MQSRSSTNIMKTSSHTAFNCDLFKKGKHISQKLLDPVLLSAFCFIVTACYCMFCFLPVLLSALLLFGAEIKSAPCDLHHLNFPLVLIWKLAPDLLQLQICFLIHFPNSGLVIPSGQRTIPVFQLSNPFFVNIARIVQTNCFKCLLNLCQVGSVLQGFLLLKMQYLTLFSYSIDRYFPIYKTDTNRHLQPNFLNVYNSNLKMWL